MAAHGLSLLAGMLLAFPRYSVWEPPKPSSAPVQRVPGFGRDPRDIGQLERQVQRDIRRGRESGDISRSEAKAFRREASYIDALESRYAQDGLSDPEIMELQNRLQALDSIIYVSGSRVSPK